MKDRELLELAAKAYWGEEIDDVCSVRWLDSDKAIGYTHGDNQDHNGIDVELLWNPLEDDGDALRLATSLGLAVVPYPIYAKPKHSVICKQYANQNILRMPSDCLIEQIELYGDNPAAATRRAIVRAAAAIGETLP